MKIGTLLLAAAGLLQSVLVSASAADLPAQSPAAALPLQSPAAALPPLAAHYRVQHVDRSTSRAVPRQADWYLLRTADRVESIRPADGRAEIWERDAGGRIDYQRVFQRERRVLDYAWGELVAQHAVPSWQAVACIVSPELLSQLKRVGPVQVLGRQAVRYRGQQDGTRLEVDWIESSWLPARLVRTQGRRTMTFTLQALLPQAAAGWPRAEPADVAHYERIDAADFGDKEGDPFLRTLLSREGHSHGLGQAHD